MPGKREIQKANRRGEILRAAMDLFSKKGFELTTVEDITRAAHVAKGTFYNFFPKKEDVLLYFLDTEYAKSIDAPCDFAAGARFTGHSQSFSTI